MRETLRIIGDTIVRSSRYLPIRQRAAQLAARAKPRDYLGQVTEIFKDITQRWRYVRDPFGREMVVTSPEQVYRIVMGGDGERMGVGDCDDVAIAVGAQLASIGFPIRLATLAPPGARPGRLMSHVFVQAQVPGIGWITVDPVVYPHHGLGYTPPHSRLATFDLTGKLMDYTGNARGLSGVDKEDSMKTDIDRWIDRAGLGDYLDLNEELADFRTYGIKDFGLYSDYMGAMNGLGLIAEVDIDDTGRAWTPMLELAPHDYEYMRGNGTPYHGMLALGDNGKQYIYDENLGFFKKLFKRIKKRVRKVIRRVGGGIRKVARKLLKKIPGGKYLIKLGKKVWKVAKKFVSPLIRFVGPIAKRLAPVAALIPGYGPAISAALYKTGKIADTMKKWGVKLAPGKKGEPSRLRFPSGNAAKAFQSELKRVAAKQKRKMQKRKSRVRSQISRGIPPRRAMRAKRAPVWYPRSRATRWN